MTCSDDNFVIYPNPANKQLTIEQAASSTATGALSATAATTPFATPGWSAAPATSSFNVKLYNASQKVVATGTASSAKLQIDTSKLPAGTYYLHIFSKEGTLQKQIIIE